jgi:hypothetical protein
VRRSGEEVGRALARIEQRLDEMTARLDEMTAQLDWLGREIGPARRILRAIAAEDAGNRRRLAETRAQPAYQLPFTNAEPLVSVVIPTHDRAELLRSRSVKSALSQTHRNIEVIVVGDDSPPEVEAAVRSHEDPRVSYHRLPTPYRASSDARAQWLVRSVMARTEGLRRARGDWLLAFDDDDEMRPDQVQRLLELARDRQAEVAYGIAARHWNDGNGDRVGAFPPEFGKFSWQSAIYHAGLGFFERQLVATEFDLPADWFMCETMLRAGVRFAMLDDVVCDIFPSDTMHAERQRQLDAALQSG